MLPEACERSNFIRKESSPRNSRLATFPSSSPLFLSLSLSRSFALKTVSVSTLCSLTNALHLILGEVRQPPPQGTQRASADSVARKRFMVSSAESGGSTVGGVRPSEAGRAATHRRAAPTQRGLPLPHTSYYLGFFFKTFTCAAYLKQETRVRVCSKMVVMFYLSSNVLLVRLLPEFDSTP